MVRPMSQQSPSSRSSSPRLRAPIFAFALSFLLAPLAQAQDGAEGEASATAQAAEAPPRAPEARPAPPPIMVVVLTSGRIAEDVSSAAQQAIVEQLTPMAGGRPVLALGAASIRDAIAACTEDACIGAQLAQAGAQAGVIARLHARGRRPLEATIEIRDPVSGAPRHAPVVGELPLDAAALPQAMSALTAQLAGSMPNPPPPPATLLVTVNVDGARVQVDGEEIGTSPVAPVEVAEGAHEIVVLAPGYLSMRRQTQVRPGEQARVDVTLQSMAVSGGSGEPMSDGTPRPTTGSDVTSEWWFWTAIGGGAAVLIAIAIGVGVAVANGAPPMQLDPSGILLPPITGGM